ncbi:MAG TPA: hypothetical protein VFO18_11750 [Methylomirabilota bacterium]|nr:hypothetical protein [Methylomirabilota bacterium]
MSRPWLPPALLAAYAVAFGYRALAGGLLVFDDHPGQLYRLHHALTIGLAPWRLDPGWWAGYAELQYYPPGFSYLGALLHYASFGRLDLAATYQLLLWITYVLPGATTYWLLSRVLGSGWLALPGAFLALTLSAGSRSGVEEGLRWGLVAARLGLGLLPLLALALLRWVEGAPRPSLWIAPLLGAVIVTHPAHVPAAVVLILAAAWGGGRLQGARLREALGMLLAGFALAAFWLLPLLAHLEMALPLAWGDYSIGVISRLFHDVPLLIVLLGLHGLAGSRVLWRDSASNAQKWLLALAPTMFLLVFLDAAVLAPLGVLWIPADRLVDSFLLALVLGAATAVAEPLTSRQALYWVAAPLVLSALLGVGRGEPLASLWPRQGEWPKYAEVTRGLRLADLWADLRTAPPGRVLFVRSAVPLAFGPEWWRPHSHLPALTPLEAGRDIVNGTFTHPSPIAGLVYTGSADRRPITSLVERRDGITLFGHPLEQITPEQFNRFAEALRISAIVALDEDQGRLRFLTENPTVTERSVIGFFRVFVAGEPRRLPESLGPQTWRLSLPAHPGGWVGTGMAWSPLWRAFSAQRKPLAVRRDGFGLLEVEAPASAPMSITLEHYPASAEYGGLAVSGAAGIVLLLAWRRQRGQS